MKKILALSMLFLYVLANAQAAPYKLVSAPYPPTGFQPNAATFTINGGAPITCTAPTVAGGIQLTCPLSSITAFGTYTLVQTAIFPQACINTTGQAQCSNGGSVPSAPFTFTYSSGLANSQPLSVTP